MGLPTDVWVREEGLEWVMVDKTVLGASSLPNPPPPSKKNGDKFPVLTT